MTKTVRVKDFLDEVALDEAGLSSQSVEVPVEAWRKYQRAQRALDRALDALRLEMDKARSKQ